MFKIALNLQKPYNYAFFCPVSKLHLTVSNPVGFVHEVTPAISKGIKNNTLLDVDGVINQTKGVSVETEQTKNSLSQDSLENPVNSLNTSLTSDDASKKKRGRKAGTKVAKQTLESQEETTNSLFEGIEE